MQISVRMYLAMPVVRGQKTEKEKFAGAEAHIYNRGTDARWQGAPVRNKP